MKILRLPEVSARVGLAKASVYRLIKHGKFPAGTQLTDRTVGWLSSDVDEWIKSKFKGDKGVI